ncbi:MAG: cytosine permease [[Clostridium] scindens]
MSNIIENMDLNPELVQNVDPDLQPTKKRIMGSLSYTASFMGGCVSIGTFSMGAGLIGVLTVGQAILAMVIGCLVIAIALVVIGNCGHKYGIPWHHTCLLGRFLGNGRRPAFQDSLRGVPAIIWSRFPEHGLAREPSAACFKILFGRDNLPYLRIIYHNPQVAADQSDLKVLLLRTSLLYLHHRDSAGVGKRSQDTICDRDR